MLRRAERGARLQQQGRYESAARTFRAALTVAEAAFGDEALEVVTPLNELAVCYQHLARFVDAGPLLQRALVIAERRLGPDHPDVATIYHNLGGLEHAAGNWSRGEPFARKAARIRSRVFGPRHPLVASALTALAALLDQQKKYEEAERLYRRALGILERTHGSRHHLVAVVLNNLAAMHQARRRRAHAESLYLRALDIDTTALGPAHPKVAFAQNNLAALIGERRPVEAAALLRRALATFRRSGGPHHPNVAVCLENFVPVLRRLGRVREAEASARRAARILSRVEAVNDDAVALTGTINPDQARFRLVVQRSPIDRLGVFAAEPIPAYRKVIEYTGERVSVREGARRSDPKRNYLFGLDRYWRIDGAIGGSGAEYINHCCAPNLKARLVRGHILYFSKRAIGRGEELTVDYQYSCEADRMPCSCGAPSCRGVMNLSRGEQRAPGGPAGRLARRAFVRS